MYFIFIPPAKMGSHNHLSVKYYFGLLWIVLTKMLRFLGFDSDPNPFSRMSHLHSLVNLVERKTVSDNFMEWENISGLLQEINPPLEVPCIVIVDATYGEPSEYNIRGIVGEICTGKSGPLDDQPATFAKAF